MVESLQFIQALRNASTAESFAGLGPDALTRLHHPPHTPLVIDDPGIRHSLSVYLALEHSSQDAYARVFRSLQKNFAGAPGVTNFQSFHAVEKLLKVYTGVEPLMHDMCPDTCLAFTGPFAALDACTTCGKSRWKEETLQGSNSRVKVPAQQFTTIPLGPQLQACFRNPESAQDMRYLWERTQAIIHALGWPNEHGYEEAIPAVDDIITGWDFLGAVLSGDIKEHDVVLMVSIDGAQLYSSKESDCWMYIWVLLNLSPDKRYRKLHVLPGGFIPGPNKPKHLDSFLFPGMHHLAALQREGLQIWDASSDSSYTSYPYLLFTTADGPGLVY